MLKKFYEIGPWPLAVFIKVRELIIVKQVGATKACDTFQKLTYKYFCIVN